LDPAAIQARRSSWVKDWLFMNDHATLVSAGGKAGSLWLGGHPFNPSLPATAFHLL
jgi:hypothetical protein